jgi:hypothetical protein
MGASVISPNGHFRAFIFGAARPSVAIARNILQLNET